MKKLFRIIEITNELVEDINSRTYDAHIHDFEELILVTEGSLEHYIDLNVETVQSPAACYVSMGKMHKLIPHKDLRGWVINFKTEFIQESELQFYSNFFNATNIPLTSGGCLNRFNQLCSIIANEYRQENTDLNAIRHLVNGLMAMVDTERKRNLPIETALKSSQIITFQVFLKILEENFRRNEGVTFYAQKMNMSERNLNLLCRNNFQKSVTEIIENRKLTEAKRLLIYSNKTVSEIGFDLGYNEKSYFTRVFHQKTGATPTQFREQAQSIIT